jgi:hypothetical protein
MPVTEAGALEADYLSRTRMASAVALLTGAGTPTEAPTP